MTYFFLPLFFSCGDTEKTITFDYTHSPDSNEVETEEEIEESGSESCENLSIQSEVVVEDCTIEPLVGEISFMQEWSIEDFMPFPEYSHILSTPVVAQLSDDNEDGIIDQEDTLDIAFVTDDGGVEPQKHGVLRIVSEGVLLLSLSYYGSYYYYSCYYYYHYRYLII